MTTQQTSTELHTRLVNLTSKDIKALVQQKGTTTEGNVEFTLKEPAATDQALQAVINAPAFEVKSIGGSESTSGEVYYDLKANGKQVRIKIGSRKVN